MDQYHKNYHGSIGKKPVDADCSAFAEKTETNTKAPKFKVDDGVRVTKYKNIFSNGYTENWSKEIFVIDIVLKTYPWTYKIKDLDGETIIGSFYDKDMLFSKL